MCGVDMINGGFVTSSEDRHGWPWRGGIILRNPPSAIGYDAAARFDLLRARIAKRMERM